MPVFVRLRNHVERALAACVRERAAKRRDPCVVAPERLERGEWSRLRLEQHRADMLIASDQLVNRIVGDAVVRTDLEHRKALARASMMLRRNRSAARRCDPAAALHPAP